MLACIILATPFPSENNSPLTFKLACCTCLLCFPLTLGTQILPFFPSGDDTPTAFIRIFSHIGLLALEGSGSSSASLSSSESAMKSITVSAVISAADSAACSLKNYTQDKFKIIQGKVSINRNKEPSIFHTTMPTFIILCLALRVLACCNHCLCLWKADLLESAWKIKKIVSL